MPYHLCRQVIKIEYEGGNTTGSLGLLMLRLGFLFHLESSLRLLQVFPLLLLNVSFDQEQTAGNQSGQRSSDSQCERPSEEIVVVPRHPAVLVGPDGEYYDTQTST